LTQIVLKFQDYTTTGYQWFFEDVDSVGLASFKSNVTGGGVTEPPYMNATFIAGEPGDGFIQLDHLRPWDSAHTPGGHIFLFLTTVE
jgi:hypothetical protein